MQFNALKQRGISGLVGLCENLFENVSQVLYMELPRIQRGNQENPHGKFS